MTTPYDCPCGAHVTDPDGLVTYLTNGLFDAVFAGVTGAVKFLGVISPLLGTPLNVQQICASPKPRQPSWELLDWVNPLAINDKVTQLLHSKIYELNCTCDDCPPLTTCGVGGQGFIVTPDDGYLPDPNEPGVRVWQTAGGPLAYIERADNFCLGPSTGVYIVWHVGGVFDPTNAVCVCNENVTGCTCWSQNVLSGTVTVYVGGTVEPAPEPIPEPPVGIPDWYGPPACSNSDICASLAITEERIRRIEFLTSVIAGPLYGVTTEYTGTFPGLANPITGTLNNWLPRALEALAPIQPAQLGSPDVTEIDGPTLIDVTGLAYVNIVPTVIPPNMGHASDGLTAFYYTSSNAPGPGYVMVVGQDGILARYALHYPAGVEIAIPSTATGLAIDVTPGVTVEVTTYERTV